MMEMHQEREQEQEGSSSGCSKLVQVKTSASQAKQDHAEQEEHKGSSSGCSKLVQVKTYASEAKQDHAEIVHVMVSIMAAEQEQEQRVPVHLALVLHVHVRFKAPDKWRELLMEAVRVVMDKLDDRDHLAIIPSGGTRISKDSLEPQEKTLTVEYTETLLPMSAKNKRGCSDAVKVAIQKCDNSVVRALELADSILQYGQGYDDSCKDRRASSYIIVISNSQDDMTSLLTWRFRSVLTFGFRDARNARTMHAITKSRDCTYAILDDDRGRVTQAFAATVDRITSGAANMPVEVELKCVGHENEKLVITAVRAPHVSYFVSSDKRKMWATARLSGSTSFIVDLSLYHGANLPWSELLTARANYGHVQVVAGDGSKEVAAEILRIKAIEIVNEITQGNETDPEKLHALADTLCGQWTQNEQTDPVKLHALADKLRAQWADLKESYGSISMLDAEMREMEIRLCNNYLWLEYMLSWKSHQWWQLPLPRMFMEDHFLRLTIFAKVEHRRAGLPVLLRVMAPEAGLAKAKRYPVDLVAVLDISRGTNEEEEKTRRRMEQLTEAMGLLMEKLSHKDRLAIVPVPQGSSVAESHDAAGLLDMSKQGRSQISAKVKSLVDRVVTQFPTASAENKAAQTSHCRQQFKRSMEQVRKWLYMPAVNSSIPTSMTAKSVEADGSTGVWKALMDAVKILDDRDQEGTEKDRLSFIIVISNSDDDSIPHPEKALNPKYIIHAFSFHNSDARTTRAMHYIASSSGGIYASLHDHRNQVTEAFRACIRRITSIIGVDTKIGITCSHSSGISLSAIESSKFKFCIGDDGRSGSIMVGKLYAGTSKNFMFYVDNAREDDYDNLSKLLAVGVEWKNEFTREEDKVDGQVVVVWNQSDGSEEVMEHIERAETGKIICKIADSYYDMVADKLHKFLEQASSKAKAAGDAPLAGEMEKIGAILHRKMRKQYPEAVDPSYVKKLVADRLANMLSWLSFQALSEQPPRIPWRTSFRLELIHNHPHEKQE